MIKIGIDPSFRKGGFWACFYDHKEKSMNFKTFENLLVFHDFLRSEDAPVFAKCVIENSNLQNSNFDKKGNKSVLQRKGRNVGTNQAVSELCVYSCRQRYGKENVKEVSPLVKGKKWTKKEFNLVIKLEGITIFSKYNNQDVRDAAKLALMK